METTRENNNNELISNIESSSSGSIALYEFSPLKTLSLISIGPILYEVGSSLFSVIDSFWIGKYLGKSALSTISSVFIPQYIVHGFSSFVFVALTAKVSFLQGKKAAGSVPSLVFDMIKLVAILSIVVPVLIFPIIQPVVHFLNPKKESFTDMKDSFFYMIPILCFFVFHGIYQLLSGVLLANGHTIVFALTSIINFTFSGFVFDPFFICFIKTGVYGSQIAAKCADIITSIIIFLYIKKKHPKLFSFKGLQFFSKFSADSKAAIRVGFSALCIQVALTIPSGVIQKFLSLSSHAIGKSSEVMGTWSLMARVYHIVTCFSTAISKGFIPSASFAFGRKDNNRIIRLFIISVVSSTFYATLVGMSFAFYPEIASFLWSNDESLSTYIQLLIPPSVYTCFLPPTSTMISALMQSVDMGKFATLLNVIGQLITLPLAGGLLYLFNKDKPEMIVYCYCISDSATFILSIILLLLVSLKKMRHKVPTNSLTSYTSLESQE